MKKKFLKVFISTLVFTSFLSLSMIPAFAAETSHGCKAENTETRSCLSSSTASTTYLNMSDIHYFPNGGALSRSSTNSSSATLSVSVSATAKWPLSSISATVGISTSITQSVGISASWNIPAGRYAQIRAYFPRKNVFLRLYDFATLTLLSNRVSVPGRNSGYYITAVDW